MIDFNELYKENYKSQVALINRFIKDVDASRDIVQEAYAKALKYQGSYDPEKSKPETWFNRIMFNVLRSYKSGDINRQSIEITGEGDLVERMPEEVSYTFDQENYELVEAEINLVQSPKSRHILTLFYLIGYRSDEISSALKVTQTSITSCCSRFKQKVMDRHNLDV